MNRRFFKILILLLLLARIDLAFPQADTLFRTVAKSEAINLNLLWYSINHGDINWENSADGTNWNGVPGETTKNYLFPADSDSYYRAIVHSGTCDPVYSRITKLQVLEISTDSIVNVTKTGATVYCSSYTDPLEYTERGIFYDTKEIPDQTSFKITSPAAPVVFSEELQNLETGKMYYVRIYVKNTAGDYFLGNISSFSTLEIAATNILNVTKTTAQLFYTIFATPQPTEHGLFYSTDPNPGTGSAKVTGNYLDGAYSATISGLTPGTSYYLLPFMKVEGKYHLGEVRAIKTFSDYSSFPVDNTTITVGHKIAWNNPVTARKISQPGYFGDYGRIKRVGNSDTLILVYHGGPNNLDWINICMRKSFDNGNTWTNQEILMNIQDHQSEYWRFCNPEVLVLKNGWVLVAYEANAKGDENKSSVQILISKDSCKTWDGPVIYPTERTWEPSMVELPNGEIELFYSSEGKWWPNDPVYQEIMQITSTDNGYSWSQQKTVAYYPYKRDGMPVPLLLRGNKGLTFAIETVGSNISPFIIKRDLASDWVLTTSNFLTSPYRWVVSNFSGHGGAPYMLQLPTGEILLSAHIYRGGDWHQNNYMQTMVGDNNAKNFQQLTSPWGILPVNESAVNNSLFLKDSETVVAVSCRMFSDGSGGIYWLEGKIVPSK